MFMKYVFEKHLCLKTRSQISMVKPTEKTKWIQNHNAIQLTRLCLKIASQMAVINLTEKTKWIQNQIIVTYELFLKYVFEA